MRDTPAQIRSARRYGLEFIGVMLLYAALLIPSILWIRANPDHVWRWGVGLIPMIAVVMAGVVIVRYFRRMDELGRRLITESLAVAFGASALLVLTLGFLEMAGLPRLSPWWTWVGMGVAWLLAHLVVCRKYG